MQEKTGATQGSCNLSVCAIATVHCRPLEAICHCSKGKVLIVQRDGQCSAVHGRQTEAWQGGGMGLSDHISFEQQHASTTGELEVQLTA